MRRLLSSRLQRRSILFRLATRARLTECRISLFDVQAGRTVPAVIFDGGGRFLLSPASRRGVDWWVNNSASPSAFLNLSVVLRGLRGAVGGWGLLGTVLILLLHRRLGEICGRMERLTQRFAAGRLWRVATRAVVARDMAADRLPRAVPSQALPRRFGWLVWLMAYRAAGYGSQLQAVLGQPEMVELLLAAPQAARILRPVCRMLAVDPAFLRPRLEAAAEVAAAEDAPVVKIRVRAPRAPVDWGRIPLPRGVLSAARRQGFGKIR